MGIRSHCSYCNRGKYRVYIVLIINLGVIKENKEGTEGTAVPEVFL